MLIRPATEADAGAITAIYNEGIADRVATFETRPREIHEVAAWLSDGLPLLVAEEDGAVLGFARVSAYSDRCVYAGVGEHGVYVARAARGRGVGRRLLEALAAASEQAGYYKLTSRVFADNAASRAVRRRLHRGRHPAAPRPARRRVEGLRARRAPARRGRLLDHPAVAGVARLICPDERERRRRPWRPRASALRRRRGRRCGRPERADVELQRPVLVGDGDDDGADAVIALMPPAPP